MPVESHAVHELTRIDASHRYGCHNHGPRDPWVRGSDAYGSQAWPFRNSQECRFDLSLSDPSCTDCIHRGSGESYTDLVRQVGA